MTSDGFECGRYPPDVIFVTIPRAEQLQCLSGSRLVVRAALFDALDLGFRASAQLARQIPPVVADSVRYFAYD